MGPVRRVCVWVLAGGLALVSCSPVGGTPAGPDDARSEAPVVDGKPFRPFTADSWWNSPVPADAPTHPDATEILDYMRTGPQASRGCVRLAGAESEWGQPVYWSGTGDPAYDVTVPRGNRPPELASMRIPHGARAAETTDGAMTVFDIEEGYVVALTDATFDPATSRWSASGATVTYLDSDGLHARTGRTAEPRNTGSHRGNNGAVMMIRYDEVAAGAVEHVVKLSSGPEVSVEHVFPMTGSDGDSTDPIAPPQGLRFRIKPSVDLDAIGLHPEALVIARALQTYGFYIGDSGGASNIKLEGTEPEGRGRLWTVPPTALCGLPLGSEFWDVLPEGHDPGR